MKRPSGPEEALLRSRIKRERKSAEERASLAHERLNYLLASTNAVIYAAQPSGDFATTFITGNVLRMTGYEAGEFKDDPDFWLDHVHPDDREYALKEVSKIFEKEFHTYEYRFQHSNGRYLWVQDEMKLIRDNKGRPLEIIGYWMDITERRLAAEALMRSEESHRLVVETTGQLIYDYDVPSGRILWAGAIEAITGHQPDEFAGVDIKMWEEMIHAEDRRSALARLEEALKMASPYHVTYRFRRKDGTYVDIEDTGAFLKDNQGKAYRMLGSMKDITEQKRAEIRLRESEEKYRSYFEDNLAGSYMSTVDGKILACNPAFARIFGFDTVEDVLKATAVSLYISPHHRSDFLQLLQRNRRLEYHEEEMKRRDGQQIRIVENVIGKFDENDRLVEIHGYIFDVTEHRKR